MCCDFIHYYFLRVLAFCFVGFVSRRAGYDICLQAYNVRALYESGSRDELDQSPMTGLLSRHIIMTIAMFISGLFVCLFV